MLAHVGAAAAARTQGCVAFATIYDAETVDTLERVHDAHLTVAADWLDDADTRRDKPLARREQFWSYAHQAVASASNIVTLLHAAGLHGLAEQLVANARPVRQRLAEASARRAG